MELNFVYILIIAFLLDTIFGDPRSLPHLIVFFGNIIGALEKRWNKGRCKLYKGAFLVLTSLSTVVICYSLLSYILFQLQVSWLTIVVHSVLLFYCLANKTLVKEGKAVFKELKEKGLEAGRKRLSWIVGRDTSALTSNQIKKAVFETMSENLSDGVIAPLFYYGCFGVLGAMLYKMINTMDSMVGYKNERYEQFGKVAAKLDDVANYIPARLTAILMLLVTLKWKGFVFVFTEGKKHSSPNAGYPEAALAYILDCQFGGPNVYHGNIVDKPFIGINKRDIEDNEIVTVAKVNYASTIAFVVLMIVIMY